MGRGVIVDLSRIADIGMVDVEQRRVRVGAGALLGAVNRAARAHGLRFPVDPSSAAFCTVGGMAATNAAGAHTLRYGAMRSWVAALDCVFADGTRAVVRHGAPPPQHVPAIRRFLESVHADILGAPAALVAAIPPTVQNAALDGSTGKRSPCVRTAWFTARSSAPGPTRTRRCSTSTIPMSAMRLRSTITPRPTAPPAIPLPDPRGTSDVELACAHRTSAATSPASRGTATARGRARAIPAPSAYTARAGRSSRKMPRKPGGVIAGRLRDASPVDKLRAAPASCGMAIELVAALTVAIISPLAPRVEEFVRECLA